jgi:hypothetical protein
MLAVLVVVANIVREPAFQLAFVKCNDVIQKFTAATPYPTLCNSILPRTFERGADRIHPQGANPSGDFPSILGITIKDAEPRSGSKWKWTIHKLLGCFVTFTNGIGPLCQCTTVSGVTAMRDFCHPNQNRRTAMQKSLSSRFSLGRGCRRFRTGRLRGSS